MKTRLSIVALIRLVIGFTSTAHAHMGDKVFSIVGLTDEELARIDIADGSVED